MNLTEWAHAQGIHVTTAYRWYREGTLRVPTRKAWLILVSSELAGAPLAAHGRRVVVLDDGEVTGDLVGDMIEVLTSFCACLYGRRSARNRALGAVGCARRDTGPQAVLMAGSVPCGGVG